MQVPMKWLLDYTDIDVDVKTFSHKMTMSGTKVEGINELGKDIENVVAGRIDSIGKHPGADRLWVAVVDTGATGRLQIVTGADNVKAGDVVPIALDGAKLPGGIVIRKGNMRGQDSFGMMCSIKELDLPKEIWPVPEVDGIMILDPATPPGMDIREVLGIDGVTVEFELTSNRQDCLGILGIAREAAVTLNKGFKMPDSSVKEEGGSIEGEIEVEISTPELCSRYTARVVSGVKVGESPEWMKRRLISSGVRPINNIVDITNYVMLEVGQPMHAFDMRFINDRKIVVRKANGGEAIETLDGAGRDLDSQMLVIADGKRAVAVAGVMGGANSEILSDTTEILLESANFNGVSIRNTSRKLGLRTDASSRFEKGLDPDMTLFAVNRAAHLIEQMGAGKVMKGVADCYPVRRGQSYVPFNADKINRMLGTSLDEKYMLDILERLEFIYDEKSGMLKVPAFRLDVDMEADLAEEVARFYDYNSIKATLNPGTETTIGMLTKKQKLKAIVGGSMLSGGLSEIYTLSFHSPKALDLMKVPEDSPLRNAVVIQNPLSEDYSIMRTSTLYDMLKAISHNHSKRAASVSLYEISHTYHMPDSGEVEGSDRAGDGSGAGESSGAGENSGTCESSGGEDGYWAADSSAAPSNDRAADSNIELGNDRAADNNIELGNDRAADSNIERGSDGMPILPIQKEALTMGMYGKGVDFFSIKGVVEDLFDALGIKNAKFSPLVGMPQFHPGKSAGVAVNGEQVGYIGEVHPDIVKNMELPEKVYAGSFDLELLYAASKLEREYSRLPRFPAVPRDIAVVVDKGVPSGDMIDLMQKYDELLEKVEIFDIYIGRQIPEGKKSVAYSLLFRSDKKTLTDDEVNTVVDGLLKELKASFGAELRS